MRLFKLFTTSLVLGLIGLFFYENATVFKTNLPFTLDLYIREQVNWTHPLYTVLVFAVLVGFVAGIGALLKPYLRMRRMLAQEHQEKESPSALPHPPALAPSEGNADEQGIQTAGTESDQTRQEP